MVALLTVLVATAVGVGSAAAQTPPDAVEPSAPPAGRRTGVGRPGRPDLGRVRPVPSGRVELGRDEPGKPEPVQDGDHPRRLLRPAVPHHAAGRARTRSATRSRAGTPVPQDEVDRTGCTTTTPSRTSSTAARRCTRTGWRTRHGKIGVDVTVFGPYRMPGKQFEYGIAIRLQRRKPVQPLLSAGAHVQPEHPHRRRQRLARGDRLPDRQLRLRQPLLRDRRPRRVVDVAGVRRDALARPERGPGAVRAARCDRGPRPQQPRRADDELGARRATSRGRPGVRRRTTGRTRVAEPRRRPRAPGRASSPTSSATCAGCRTTTTTRSPTTTGTSPATGR